MAIVPDRDADFTSEHEMFGCLSRAEYWIDEKIRRVTSFAYESDNVEEVLVDRVNVEEMREISEAMIELDYNSAQLNGDLQFLKDLEDYEVDRELLGDNS